VDGREGLLVKRDARARSLSPFSGPSPRTHFSARAPKPILIDCGPGATMLFTVPVMHNALLRYR